MIDPKNMKNDDFMDFIKFEKTSSPEKLDAKILNYVKRDIDPSHKQIFFKLLCIQSFIGIITLLFCPQFDLSITNNFTLFHFFHHKFGESICMAICGAIFMGSGALFASYILSNLEMQKIRKSKLLYYLSLSLLAISIFFILGAELYLKLTLFWIIGATMSGFLAVEINHHIKIKKRAH